MCEPITAALATVATTAMSAATTAASALASAAPALGVLTSIGSAATGFMGASQQARAQNRAYRENAYNAAEARKEELNALQIRRNQQAAAAGQQEFNVALDGLRQRSTAQVSAGAAGVQGNSVDMYIQGLFAQEGRLMDSIDQQLDVDMTNNYFEQRGAYTREQNRINSVQRATPPSPLPFIIQGFSGALNAMSGPRGGQVAARA